MTDKKEETLGKILEITEKDFKYKPHSWVDNYEGIIVTTDKDQIKVGIETGRQCCESSGYMMSEDDYEDFIGAELLSVEVVDESLITHPVSELRDGFTMFVNFNTSKGLLQFAAYNEHNGYYGHNAIIVSKGFNHSETL